MLGAGTSPGVIVRDPAPARLLDLSRLVSRAGRRPTGIDRVELAYLKAFLADTVPVFGLIRSAWGFLLLDRQGCQALLDRVSGHVSWGQADLLSRLRRNLSPARQCAESDLRRVAMARRTARSTLLGIRCRNTMRRSDAPTARAASTNSFSLSDSTTPRTMRAA